VKFAVGATAIGVFSLLSGRLQPPFSVVEIDCDLRTRQTGTKRARLQAWRDSEVRHGDAYEVCP
jgi:hypothetical protein